MRFRIFEYACACLLGLALAQLPTSARAAAGAASQATSSGSANGAAGAAGTEWAAWINRDIEIDLKALPKVYSCDELWYKLHAILLAIGARQYMAITPYYCGKAAQYGGRSPSVHLRFQTLREVTGKQIRWANTRAIDKTVVLAPGEPKRLDAGDCALVQQLEGTLLAYLDVPVSTARFECSAPAARNFDLSVRVLERWPEKLAAD